MKVFFTDTQAGGTAISTALAVASITLMMGYSQLNKVSNDVKQTKMENAKNYLNQRNHSALSMASTLFGSGDENNPPAVYPQMYIPQNLRMEDPRILNTAATDKWSSRNLVLTVAGTKQENLAQKNEQKFNNINSSGIQSIPDSVNDTTLRVEGFRVNAEKTFLIEAVYLRAMTVNNDEALNKSQYLLAEVPVAKPPKSDCFINLTDPAQGRTYPPAANGAGRHFSIKSDALSLNVSCNYVVTELEVWNDDERIDYTKETPTAANSYDSTFKRMLPPITLSPRDTAQNIVVIAKQPDDEKVSFTIKIDQQPTANPQDCAYRCDSIKEVWACDPSYWVHRDYYQNWDPTKHVCYRCNIFMGFDPANNCQGVQVGTRDAGGCFAEDTQILMGDGSQKRADMIRPGDEVYNPIINRSVKVKEVIAGPENAQLIAVSIASRKLKVSQQHPFITNVGPVAAHLLQVGDKILDIDGSYRSITKIENVEPTGSGKVWNFVLDGDYQQMSHLLVGDGIVSGDLILQKQSVNRDLIRFAFDINE